MTQKINKRYWKKWLVWISWASCFFHNLVPPSSLDFLQNNFSQVTWVFWQCPPWPILPKSCFCGQESPECPERHTQARASLLRHLGRGTPFRPLLLFGLAVILPPSLQWARSWPGPRGGQARLPVGVQPFSRSRLVPMDGCSPPGFSLFACRVASNHLFSWKRCSTVSLS